MTLLAEYRGARHDEDVARLRRVLALRAMAATGMSQRELAAALGISQPATTEPRPRIRFQGGMASVRLHGSHQISLEHRNYVMDLVLRSL